jgi:hypothetical protein
MAVTASSNQDYAIEWPSRGFAPPAARSEKMQRHNPRMRWAWFNFG